MVNNGNVWKHDWANDYWTVEFFPSLSCPSKLKQPWIDSYGTSAVFKKSYLVKKRRILLFLGLITSVDAFVAFMLCIRADQYRHAR